MPKQALHNYGCAVKIRYYYLL